MAKITSSLLIMLIFGSLMIVPAQASVVDDISGSLTNFEKAATGTTTSQSNTLMKPVFPWVVTKPRMNWRKLNP